METHFVEAHGIRVAYLEAGPPDGPLALCLHGFPDHAPTWEGLLGDLGAAGFRAVAPWLRGYAPSGAAPDGNYEAASLALDALALTDALAPGGDAVLVGHDWGAIAAYTAAGHRPDRFRRLVTMAVPHPASLMSRFLSSPDQLQRSWYIFFFQSPLADVVVPADDFAVVDKLWRDWSPGFTPDPTFMRALKDTLAAPAPAGFGAAVAYYRFMLGTLPGDPALAGVQGRAWPRSWHPRCTCTGPTTAAWGSTWSWRPSWRRCTRAVSRSGSWRAPGTSCTSNGPAR